MSDTPNDAAPTPATEPTDTEPVQSLDGTSERWSEEEYNPETDDPPAEHHHQDEEDPEDLPPLGGD